MRVSTLSTMRFGVSWTRIAWAWPGSFLISIVYLRCFLDNVELLFLNELHDILHHIQCPFTQCVLCFYILIHNTTFMYEGLKCKLGASVLGWWKGVYQHAQQKRRIIQNVLSAQIFCGNIWFWWIFWLFWGFTYLLFTEYFKRIINNHWRSVIVYEVGINLANPGLSLKLTIQVNWIKTLEVDTDLSFWKFFPRFIRCVLAANATVGPSSFFRRKRGPFLYE